MNSSFTTRFPDSRTAHTYNGPNDVMMPCRRADTITFPAILLSTSPTPIGHNPGFLCNEIRQQGRKSSRVFAKSFLMDSSFIMLAMVVDKSGQLSANCLDVRILFQPSAFIL